MRSIRRLLVVTATLAVALTGFAAAPAAAVPPDPPCEWEPAHLRTHSGCDGLVALDDPHVGPCSIGVKIHEVEIGPPGEPLARVALNYHYGGGACRTVHAEIVVVNSSADCYAKIERNSDRQAYRVGGEHRILRQTQVLYDAGVTSYAWGYCTDIFGNPYSAGTPSY